MTIRWKNVKITDKDAKDHLSFKARTFILNNCPDAVSDTESRYKEKNKTLADTVLVNLPDGGTSFDLKNIKDVLSTALGKIGARLALLEGSTGFRQNLPVGRAVTNVVNVNPTKLKVEFIYNRAPKGSKSRAYLEDSKVTVTALREGATQPLTKITDKGIADFDVVMPGKYKITADYPKSDECKYDWIDKTRDVQLNSGSEEIVELQVEPLYQKVQLIAHCILAVPDFKFVLTEEDKKKVDVTIEPSGKQTFAFKTANVQVGFYVRFDLSPPILSTKAKIESLSDGSGTLTLLQQKIPNQFWELTDLTLNESVIEKKQSAGKNIFNITLKTGEDLTNFKLNDDDSAKATITLFPPGVKLTLLAKTRDTTLAEVQNQIDQNADKLEIIRQSPGNANVYEIQFKPKFKDVTYTKKDLKGGWMGQYHGLEDDKADMTERINLVKATLELAYQKAKDDPVILKVFMIPECFFQGRYGAYRFEDAGYLFSELLKLVGDVKWKDWIFVFGTVNLTYGEDIREMMNYSPVIRGGLGSADKRGDTGGESDERLRLIQKMVNSAELLDDNQIIHHVNEARIPAVNDTVQFQPTENEEKVGSILKKLLTEEPDFGERHGLKKEYWDYLKTEFLEKERALGLTRVVRLIRGCQIAETPTALTSWVSGYEDIVMAHLLPSMCINVTWKRIIYSIINTAWDKYCKENLSVSVPPDCNEDWGEVDEPGPTRRTSVLTDIRDRLDALSARFGIIVPSQKDILREEIQTLLDDDAAAIKYYCEQVQIRPVKIVPPEIPLNFKAGVYPMWKNILMFYCAEKKIAEGPLTPKDENMNYRDYCFAARRKAGHWLSLEEVKSLDPCKKLIFGLEICADHAAGRLKKLVQQPIPESLPITAIEKDRKFREIKIAEIKEENKKKPNVTINIQLLPSAGMFPGSEYVVAQKNGYLFNCDGWNKGKEKGVNIITKWFNGPEVEADNENKMANPVTPHTAIAKGGGGSLDMDKFKPERINLETEIQPAPDKNILNKTGIGELHIYEELDLPKN